jgi:ParB-like chromosome segregation protein Spo0J
MACKALGWTQIPAIVRPDGSDVGSTRHWKEGLVRRDS